MDMKAGFIKKKNTKIIRSCRNVDLREGNKERPVLSCQEVKFDDVR